MLDSVRSQTQPRCEVIIVDQSGGAIDELLRAYPEVVHVRSGRRGLSLNRNIGIAHASGRVIAFPDDDCVLPPQYLEEVALVARRFTGDTLFAFGNARQIEDGRPYLYRHTIGSIRRLTASNCYQITSWALVYDRSVFDRIGGFDEDFGVGSTYGSAEEADMMLRLLDSGIDGLYAEKLDILHPARPKHLVSVEVHRSYSEGIGALARKHWRGSRNWPFLLFFIRTLCRSLGGIVLTPILRDGLGDVYVANFAAKVRGFLRYRPLAGAPRQIARSTTACSRVG